MEFTFVFDHLKRILVQALDQTCFCYLGGLDFFFYVRTFTTHFNTLL